MINSGLNEKSQMFSKQNQGSIHKYGEIQNHDELYENVDESSKEEESFEIHGIE